MYTEETEQLSIQGKFNFQPFTNLRGVPLCIQERLNRYLYRGKEGGTVMYTGETKCHLYRTNEQLCIQGRGVCYLYRGRQQVSLN